MDSGTAPLGRGPSFPSTLWSDILRAADPGHPQNRERLDLLFRRYWRPVFAYVRAAGRKSFEDSKDLTQAFFAHFLDRDYLARLRPEKGSFRGYLKRAIRHFLVDAYRAEEVRKPVRPAFSLDASPMELDRIGPAAPEEEPEVSYDREWFVTLVDGAIEDLEGQLARDGKSAYIEVFRLYCLGERTPAPDSPPPTYDHVAVRLGIKETDVRNYLTHCRRILREILCARIREYVSDPAEVEEELARVLGRER
jgi:RNA polymerase sigma factor (sigma-70 family)